MSRDFIPGLELARLYYTELVRPFLDSEFPGVAHSAALVGWGSDVLGYDSPRSTDHNWGPRLQIFVAPADARDRADAIMARLAERLPATFHGYPTIFPVADVPGAVAAHWVHVAGLSDWLTGALGFDPAEPVQLIDWLATPTQILAEITGGAVFHDGLPAGPADTSDRSDRSDRSDDRATAGALTLARRNLAWYPDDVWRYVLACQWQRIAQEEPFPGRCAESGDDVGSAVISARLVRDLMRLVLLMERRYPPYGKWLGTAVARTGPGAALLPLLTAALAATSWPERERSLCAAYEAAAGRHNELGLTAPLDPAVRPRFYSRPYRVLDAGRFAAALRDQIGDNVLRSLPLVGAVDQFTDSTDALGSRAILRAAVAAELGLIRA